MKAAPPTSRTSKISDHGLYRGRPLNHVAAVKSAYEDAWFDWSDGNIETKNPDPPIIEKAIQIAQRLQARVQGDDGEVYLPDGVVESGGVIQTGAGMDWRHW